jgi:glycosyltransferase involved in cell wall biosynthesis
MNQEPIPILVLTTCYPKWQGDTNGLFLEDLCKRLQPTYKMIVLAPWESGLKRQDVLSGITVYRHPQFFWPVNLAYGDDILDKLRKNPLKWGIIPVFFAFQLLYIWKLYRKYSIRLIHAHWIIPSGFTAVFYKLIFGRKTKVLITAHGDDVWSFLKRPLKWILMFILQRADTISGVSTALVEKLIEMAPSKPIFLGPMGVNTLKFHQKSKLYNANKVPIILFVGRLRQGKGILELMEALVLLNQRQVQYKALIVGEGMLRQELLGIISNAKLEQKITLTGIVGHDELPEIYAAADIFILPSHSEGLGLVYLEAMSSGVLTIASPLPTIKDIIQHGETGIILKNTTPTAIADCLESVLNDLISYKEMAKKGQEFAIKTFDWEKVAETYHGQYKNTISEEKQFNEYARR